MRFADLKNDFVFRRVFGKHEASKRRHVFGAKTVLDVLRD
jgi:hypothetical protein